MTSGGRPRSVLTGVGLLSPTGDEPDDVGAALLAGTLLASEDELGFPAVSISDFDPKRYVDRKGLKNLSRTSQLACSAASRLRDTIVGVGADEIGVVLGTAWASMDTVVRFEHEAYLEGPRFVDPLLFTETVANVPAGQISIFTGWSAFNVTISSGTNSGIDAICQAVRLLEEGRAAVAVAGGADELNQHLLRTLHAEGLVSPTVDSRPFSPASQGPIGSEAACLFAIGGEQDARARGAEILGCIDAAASRFIASDAAESTQPWLACVDSLLRAADMTPADVDLLVLSANGTPSRDQIESAIWQELFEPVSTPVLVPKAILGETWSASGPLAVVAGLEAARASRIPPPPASLAPSASGGELRLPREDLDRPVRRFVVLDCSETGHFSGLVVSVEPGPVNS